MATNPIGHNSANLTANIPKSLKQAIKEKAEDSNLTISTFVRVILEDAIRREVDIKTTGSARKEDQKSLIHDILTIELEEDSGERIERRFDHYRNLWGRNFEPES